MRAGDVRARRAGAARAHLLPRPAGANGALLVGKFSAETTVGGRSKLIYRSWTSLARMKREMPRSLGTSDLESWNIPLDLSEVDMGCLSPHLDIRQGGVDLIAKSSGASETLIKVVSTINYSVRSSRDTSRLVIFRDPQAESDRIFLSEALIAISTNSYYILIAININSY